MNISHNQLQCYLAFSYCPFVGPVMFKKILEVFENVENAYHAKNNELRHFFGEKFAYSFDHFRKNFIADSTLSALFNNHIHILPYGSTYYPYFLVHLHDPPICLFAKGDIKIFDISSSFFSIVGTRKPSPYGKKTTSMFARQLSRNNFIIVSGMAIGIDTVAHESATKTVAVLGGSIDKPYPACNRALYNDIIENKGAVVSEFPPGLTTRPWHFISRNRIVSGLSVGTLVVEGTERSGALITASCAAHQSRDVYAIPGQIDSLLSQAPNILIQNGARPVLSPTDIICEYPAATSQKTSQPAQLSLLEKALYDKLSECPYTASSLSKHIKMPINEILITLTTLELKGHVEKNDDDKYRIIMQ